MRTLIHIVTIILILALSGCTAHFIKNDPGADIPRAEREFRGVWVATVGNIDWPSKPGLTTEEQKREAIAILDTVASLNMNAVVFQVRPHADAFYASNLEPWSYYLTGEQGKPPSPYYDPLEFWISEAHSRGIELHAWFNPYRAHLSRGGEITDSSIVRKRPDLARQINEGMYWLDPSKKETQDLSYNVVMDVVRRYNVDGIHFDDYFYPYNDGKFPDDDSWDEFRKTDSVTSREDWRRSHVNTFIERVYKGIKKEKKSVKFGLSPFGIWRPKHPASIAGYDQYNMLYADAKLWLNKGWIDYWTPQLYWPVNQIPQSFPVLLGWWTKENVLHRNLWPGMIISRSRDEKAADETFNQIMITRGFVPEGPGHILFSMKAFLRDSSVLNGVLKNGPYKKKAITPAFPWLDDIPPATPIISAEFTADSVLLQWKPTDKTDLFISAVYIQYNSTWDYFLLPKGSTSISFPLVRTVQNERRSRNQETAAVEIVERFKAAAVTAIDRCGNESATSQLISSPESGGNLPQY